MSRSTEALLAGLVLAAIGGLGYVLFAPLLVLAVAGAVLAEIGVVGLGVQLGIRDAADVQSPQARRSKAPEPPERPYSTGPDGRWQPWRPA